MEPLQPGARAFLAALAAQPGPPLEQLPVAQARAAVVAAQSGAVAAPEAIVRRCNLGGVDAYVYRAPGLAGRVPAALYFHGGGWVLCDHSTHDRLMRDLASRSGAAMVFVEYSRAPEERYPIALEEAYTAASFIAQHGGELGIDGSRIAVVGDSAGANLAAALTMLVKRRGGPHIREQVLLFPVTDAGMDTPSYRAFGEGFFLTAAQMRWFWDCYAPERERRFEPTASPLRASLDELHGLPPALVITADHDPLRDEGEAYARRLEKAGVPVTQTRHTGTIHAFMVLNALSQDSSPRYAIAQTAAALKEALQ